jgi:hypothetical protein
MLKYTNSELTHMVLIYGEALSNADATRRMYRVIHERGISEFLFAATHYTHCNNILISIFENNYN